MTKTFRTIAGMLVLTIVVAACGSSSHSSGNHTSTGSTTPAVSGSPGVGKPPVVIGDKNFSEEYILGSLYQEALQAKGYKVTLKGNIGSTEITYKALQAGQIDMYPEYTGVILTVIAGNNTPPHSSQQSYTLAKAYLLQHGFTLLAPTPFFDTDALGTLKTFATNHHLKTIADLKNLGTSWKLGGAPEFATREQGLLGLKRQYGLNPTFVPLAIGLTYTALDTGKVQVSDVFTTDPQLTTGKYTILTDPKNVFGFQNVAPIVRSSLITTEGPAFAQTINKVSALLTIPAIQKMNAAVAIDQQSPSTVAHTFLAANGLL